MPLDSAFEAPIRKLASFLELARQGYAICICNASRDRQAVLDYLASELAEKKIGIYRLELTGGESSVPGRIRELLESADYQALAADFPVVAVSVSNIEATIREDERDLLRRPDVIQGLNQQRDKVRTWGFPIIFWFSEWLAGRLRELAPDFWGGRSTEIEFPGGAEKIVPEQSELSIGPWTFGSEEETRRKIRIYEDLARGTTDKAREAGFLLNIGIIRMQLGEYAEAREQYEQGLRLFEELDDQASTAGARLHLGYLRYLQGEYAEAESLLHQALVFWERAAGGDHPNVASALNTLAAIHRAQGRLSDAEPLSQRALKIDEKALGEDHPAVASDLNNLAGLYQEQGRLSDAEPLLRRALEITEKVLGEDHPRFATDVNNLAMLYRAQGRLSDAEPLLRRALEIDEKVLGKDHPNVAAALNNLAILYQDQGRLSDAEPLFRRALEIQRAKLPAEHPYNAGCLTSLAALYVQLNRESDARECLDEANAIWAKRGEAKKQVAFDALRRHAPAQMKK